MNTTANNLPSTAKSNASLDGRTAAEQKGRDLSQVINGSPCATAMYQYPLTTQGMPKRFDQWAERIDDDQFLKDANDDPKKMLPVEVVFTVMTGIGNSGPDDDILAAQIQRLNDAYSGADAKQNYVDGPLFRTWPDLLKPGIPNVKFHLNRTRRFSQSDAGKAFSGLIDLADTIKGNAAMAPVDTTKFLNIYIGNMVSGLFGEGPLSSNPGIDAVLVSLTTLPPKSGSNTDLYYLDGKSMCHEVGHYFNLLHIWGNVEGKGCSVAESLTDSYPVAGPHGPRDKGDYSATCKDKLPIPVRSLPELKANYMDYSVDLYRCMFTPDQAVHIRRTLLYTRASLLGTLPTTLNFKLDFARKQAMDRAGLSFMMNSEAPWNKFSGDVLKELPLKGAGMKQELKGKLDQLNKVGVKGSPPQ